jgi:hypothetical protein
MLLLIIIEPIEDIVCVVGAGGQEVPFFGYVTIVFLKTMSGFGVL